MPATPRNIRTFYIASGLPNAERVKSLRDKLVALDLRPSYDWTEHGYVLDKTLAIREKVAQSEIKGVLSADIVIVLHPGGRGTHVELGAAIAQAELAPIHAWPRLIYLVGAPPECVFYDHPAVTRIATAEMLVAKISSILSAHRTV